MVNAERRPSPSYLVLHRAQCAHTHQGVAAGPLDHRLRQGLRSGGIRRRMDYYFSYGRGRLGIEAPLEGLAEAHWSFMDRCAEAMIARGRR